MVPNEESLQSDPPEQGKDVTTPLVRLLNRMIPVVFVSGACSLVYQVLWMRGFRLVFGASTLASAAVIAIFMGGLGLGSYVLGRKVDQSSSPLKLYAKYEMFVALGAALSPLAIWGVEQIYYATGGSVRLGLYWSYVVRLLLAVPVLALPTFFMGGTLAAAAKAVQSEKDHTRRSLGVIYGSNTLGAVTGVVLATFFAVEIFGVRSSMWLAAAANVLIGVYVLKLDRIFNAGSKTAVEGEDPAPGLNISADTWPEGLEAGEREMKRTPTVESPKASRPKESTPRRTGETFSSALDGWNRRFVFLSSAWVGFCFFAIEMVWYRVFAPLLGGSSYSFGIVLAVALLGIGVGGALFGRARHKQSTILHFSVTCAIEALVILIPFALGDRIAAATSILLGFGVFGFWGFVGSWTVVAMAVVFLPSLIAGYQFPLLVSILGRGKKGIGEDVGHTYLYNTLGGIAGAIGSGFGLMSILGANGLWVALALSLVAVAFIGLAISIIGNQGLAPIRARSRRSLTWVALLSGGFAVILSTFPGPSAAWRHSPIGAGRFQYTSGDWESLENRFRQKRRHIVWEADGRETTVGISDQNGYAFLVNGKTDGNVRGDAGTQVMCSLLGAMVHGSPKSGLVIGLGTGMSAGWLAEVDTMQRVDVAELEPAILEMARRSKAVNFDVTRHPKVEIHIADGREFLQTTNKRYDVIMSEPSNPYRAGVASLFSQDFYRVVKEHLDDEGVFVQWIQAYEVDGQTVRSVIATLGSVFASVEIWSTQTGDLALISKKRDKIYNVDEIRSLSESEPYRSALRQTWGLSGVEGFFAGFRAGPGLARKILELDDAWIDTDDQPVVEFGFSRTLGQRTFVSQPEIERAALQTGSVKPTLEGTLDWSKVLEARALRDLRAPKALVELLEQDKSLKARMRSRSLFGNGKYEDSLKAWLEQKTPAVHMVDIRNLAVAAAKVGHPMKAEFISQLKEHSPVDVKIVSAIDRAREKQPDESVVELVDAFITARQDPWFNRGLMVEALSLGDALAKDSKGSAKRLFEALAEPFAVRVVEGQRRSARLSVGIAVDPKESCRETLAEFEPHVPWEQGILAARVQCYEWWDDSRKEAANDDYLEYMDMKFKSFSTGLEGSEADGKLSEAEISAAMQFKASESEDGDKAEGAQAN